MLGNLPRPMVFINEADKFGVFFMIMTEAQTNPFIAEIDLTEAGISPCCKIFCS